MLMLLTVERVLSTCPHAHEIVASPYLGWISFFMIWGFRVPHPGGAGCKKSRATYHPSQALASGNLPENPPGAQGVLGFPPADVLDFLN